MEGQSRQKSSLVICGDTTFKSSRNVSLKINNHICVTAFGIMCQGSRSKVTRVTAGLTLYRQRFSLRKTYFLPLKRFLKGMVPNATKLCYKSVFLHFSSILSQLLLKIVHYFGFRHAHKPKFADSFLIFSRFFCFPFSLPFFSLYLLPFITFLSTGKVLASVLLKTWKWNIDQLGDLAYFTTNFAAKIGHVFLV